MREFYRLVHPDMSSGMPSEAITTNSNSLMELNAYLDRLLSATTRDSPFVARTISFYVPVVKKDGSLLNSSIRPFSVTLESIPPDADSIDTNEISEGLLRQLQAASRYIPTIQHTNKEYQHVDKILSNSSSDDPTSVRSKLAAIWYKEHEQNRVYESIYDTGNDSSKIDYVSLREYKAMLAHNKLVRKYSRIENPRKRAEKLNSIETTVSSQIGEPLIADPPPSDNKSKKLNLIKSGYHPDLVFFRPHLSKQQRQIGIQNVCGEFLSDDQDIWLLENVWYAMRKAKKPPVPLVLSDSWKASTDGGYIEVPYDFQLGQLADFLEDNLESVRQARKDLLDNFTAV